VSGPGDGSRGGAPGADDPVARWLAASPYARALGVALAEREPGRVVLRLPFREANANPGRALHGGCAASLAAIGAGAVARAALGPEAGPFHGAGLQVSYLAAAIGQDVVAEARLLRRAKELCFAEVDLATDEGRTIAHATALVHARRGQEEVSDPPVAGDDGATDPGPMGPHIEALPFIAARGIRVEHMTGGRSRLRMPAAPANADAEGGVHEGAVLALLDTTGAMAAWAETGPGRYKASTPAIQARILAPAPDAELVAFGRVSRRDHELFFCDVEVACARSLRPCARGTVLYRIVT
jgi:uncharacterized protein (TIGR00369 family)